LKEAKKYIKQVIGDMPMFTTSRQQYLQARRNMIADLRVSGHEKPEALFDSVWPSLKPTEEESAHE
jgi:hypothetical protein